MKDHSAIGRCSYTTDVGTLNGVKYVDAKEEKRKEIIDQKKLFDC